jgi:hypothetical protein
LAGLRVLPVSVLPVSVLPVYVLPVSVVKGDSFVSINLLFSHGFLQIFLTLLTFNQTSIIIAILIYRRIGKTEVYCVPVHGMAILTISVILSAFTLLIV